MQLLSNYKPDNPLLYCSFVMSTLYVATISQAAVSKILVWITLHDVTVLRHLHKLNQEIVFTRAFFPKRGTLKLNDLMPLKSHFGQVEI